MNGVNKVILLGRLGGDPEIKYTNNGSAVANFSMATTEKWKASNGEKQERTEWHRVVMFGKLAELAKQFLKKGSQLYLEGKLQTNKWQDKNGLDRYTTNIVGEEMQFLDAKIASGTQDYNHEDKTPF